MIKLIIFILSLTATNALLAHEYAMNFLRVNSAQMKNSDYFCANQDEESYKKDCLQPILDWIEKSKSDAEIIISYDSFFSNEKALERIKSDILLKMECMTEKPALSFLDIRDLELIKKNAVVFSDALPIYFRVDLLRVIVAYYLALLNPKRLIGYTDFNVPAHSKEELLDQSTLDKLKLYGLVLAQNKAGDFNNPYENGFFIMDPENKEMMQAIKFGLIDINIARGYEFLDRGFTTKEHKSLGSALCKSKFPEILWISYRSTFSYYLYLNMAAEIVPLDQTLDSISNTKLLYNNIDLINPTPVLLPKDVLSSLLYKSGFARPVPHWTFKREGPGLIQHFILKPLRALLFDEELEKQNILAEKLKRINIHESNMKLFDIHNSKFQPDVYFWTQKVIEVFPGDKNSNKTSVISLEKDVHITIPTKDVKKPASHFYNSKAELDDNDC